MAKYILSRTQPTENSANGIWDTEIVYKQRQYSNWPIAHTTPSKVVRDNLRIYYDPSSYNNDIAIDLSGNNNNGTLNNITNANNVWNFSGNASEITTFFTYNNIDPFSSCGWFKAIPNSTGHRIIGFETNQAGTGSGGYDKLLYLNPNGNAIFASFSGPYITSSLSYNDNRWHFFAVTHSISGLHNLYIDNSFIGSSTNLKTSATVYFRIGGYKVANWPDGIDNYFQGNMGYILYYNRVLSRNEISFNYLYSRGRFV